MPPKRASRQIAIAIAARMLAITERRHEAVSGMKEDSRCIEKGRCSQVKNGTIQDEVYPHIAENDMRMGAATPRPNAKSIVEKLMIISKTEAI